MKNTNQNNLKAVSIKMKNKNTETDSDLKKKILIFLNSISASEITSPISYLFFLNTQSRYVADAFLIENKKDIHENSSSEILLISTPKILQNLIAHIQRLDFRKSIDLIDQNLYIYQTSENISEALSPAGAEFYTDPRNENWKIIISEQEMEIHNTWDDFRVESEIAEFEDFEFEKSIILEYGKIAKFIASSKGCYLGQELMQRVRTQGSIRKTVKKLPINEENNENIIKILTRNEKHILALMKI